MEYTTKSGKKVTYTYTHDTEQENRGWVIDKVTIHVGGTEAGYMKIGYIPKANIIKYYPTVEHYTTLISGSSILPSQRSKLYPADIMTNGDMSMLRRIVKNMSSAGYIDRNIQDKNLTDNEVHAYIKQGHDRIERVKGQEYKDHIAYFKDNPLVDFLQVHEQFRGEGLSLVLYIIAALEMKKRGMKLFSSNLKTDLGQAAWDANKKKLNLKSKTFKMNGKSTVRYYIDV